MIFTAYFDESGTHAGSPVTVMAGVMTNARKWERFEAEFRAAKRRHGFNVFHTKKFKSRSGDFKGWSSEQCLALVDHLSTIANDSSFTESVVMVLDNDLYENEYLRGEKPRKLRLDSKYGLCFRECLYHLLVEAQKRRHKNKALQLHVVLEGGHKNAGDARRIFDEVRADLNGSELDFLKPITFADKDECDPLMAADFIAHSTYRRDLKTRAGEPVSRHDESARRKRLVTLQYKPGGLSNIKDGLVKEV